jgi:VWFA-related protein
VIVRRTAVGCVLGVALVIVAVPVRTQPPAQGSSYRIGADAVMVDVTVRDARGNPVTDLGRDDFELPEDGARQTIVDVTLVAPPSGGAAPDGKPAAGRTPIALDADRDGEKTTAAYPSFVALVFDRLGTEARMSAYEAAAAYLDGLSPSGEAGRAADFVGVFRIDLSLQVIHGYSSDTGAVRGELEDVVSRPSAVFDRDATRDLLSTNAAGGDVHPNVPFVAGAESAGRPGDFRSQSPEQVTAAALRLDSHASWERMARDQQGYATTGGLMAIASALGPLPGRKTIVFFGEGIAIPDAVLPHFEGVVATANRGNVSIYTVDAAGLRVHSKDAEIGREVRAMGAEGLRVNPDGSSGSTLGLLERNEDVLRKDPRTSLTLLAQRTGGFLIENTNDLAAGFRRIDADRRFHYLLSYSPSNGRFDGEWRAISVRVPGRRVPVRHRTGYLAVRSPAAFPLLGHEGPALAALGRQPPPADVPLQAAAFVFPVPGGGLRVPILATAEAAHLVFDTTTSQYRTDFTILARIRDRTGAVVAKVSEPYRLGGAVEKVDRARTGQIMFYRQLDLTSGAYTLDAAVHDRLAARAGVTRMAFDVPADEPGAPRVSSLVIVGRAEQVPPGDRDPANPLYIGDSLIYPRLGEPIALGPAATVGFLVAVVPPPGIQPSATLQLLRTGALVAEAPLSLPPADADGSIKSVGQIPIAHLAPSDYLLRVIVTSGDHRQVREAAFRTVAP